jgi:hypothetical protein
MALPNLDPVDRNTERFGFRQDCEGDEVWPKNRRERHGNLVDIQIPEDNDENTIFPR